MGEKRKAGQQVRPFHTVPKTTHTGTPGVRHVMKLAESLKPTSHQNWGHAGDILGTGGGDKGAGRGRGGDSAVQEGEGLPVFAVGWVA